MKEHDSMLRIAGNLMAACFIAQMYGMDLTFPDRKADIPVGHDTVGVDLCDMFHFQDLFAHTDPSFL